MDNLQQESPKLMDETVPELAIAYPAIPQEEMEELAHDGFGELQHEPVDPVHIERRLYAIAKLEEDVMALKRQKESSVNFYDVQMERHNMRIGIIKQQITWYLKSHSETKMKTPYGTAFISNRTKVNWPSDEEILAFAKVNYPELVKTTVVEKVSKTDLKKGIEEKGVIPDNYTVEAVESLSIR